MQLILLISIALVSFFILGMVGTVILSSITGIGIKELAHISNWKMDDPGMITFIRGMQLVQFISLFVVPVFLCARLFSTNSREYLGLKPPYQPGYYFMGIAVMILALPLVGWLGELNSSIPFPPDMTEWMKSKEDDAARMVKALLSQHTIKDLLLNIFFIAVLAAVGEELLFRGIAQRLFIRIFKSPVAGIVVSAILFSAMHVQFFGFLPRLALGVVLGFLYWYSGSLWTAIVAHFVYDASLIVLAYMKPEMITSDNVVETGNVMIAGLVSLVIVVLGVIWMKRNSRTKYPDIYADDNVPVKDHPF